jgi:serine/threonine protein kinase
VGPYEIEAPLGAGGMGEVYRARDLRLGRTVAIKILPQAAAADAQFRERFEREARAISQLNHPHICVLHDVGREDDIDFLVFEYLEGQTLSDRLLQGPMPVAQALDVAADVCDALVAAHHHGIVHRDLKPGNVMLTKSGAKLLDFGIARRVSPFVTAADAATRAPDPNAARQRLTTAGTLVGTVQYIAPEQLEGQESDGRADIWAFGCLLFEMLTGAAPFDGRTPATVIAAILGQPAPRVSSRATVPPAVDRIVATCLERDPDERWQSARDLLRELRWAADEVHAGPSPAPAAPAASRPLRTPAGIAAAILLLLLGFAGAVWLVAGRTAMYGRPVIVLMDSPHPERVYDPETRKAGGTNADDLTDLLRDLPVTLVKENTSATWHREEQVVEEQPTLILAHRSCFYDASFFSDPKQSEATYPFAADKFELFMAYAGLANARTRFIAYSRRSWDSPEAARKWVAAVEQRFPVLRGRLQAWPVPLDRATFRHPRTGAEFKALVTAALQSRP